MASPATRLLPAVCLLALARAVSAQQAVVPPDLFRSLPAVNADGMALAQNSAAIDQARLYRDATAPRSTGVTADGMALPEAEPTAPPDDSFGAQMILKNQERVRSFVLTGGASFAFTNNVALTRRAERHDVFAVVDAGIGWSRQINSELEGNFAAHASIFRYDRTPALDFENLGFGAGLTWAPRRLAGASVFARYEFTELLDHDGDQILMEHALSVGVQKSISLGRSHGFALGAYGTVAFADPEGAQREQIAAFLSYHLQLTRKWETTFLYRPAVHFYTDNGRTDFNQIISVALRYRFTEWADLNLSFSHGLNRSDESVFDYGVITSGAAITLGIRF